MFYVFIFSEMKSDLFQYLKKTYSRDFATLMLCIKEYKIHIVLYCNCANMWHGTSPSLRVKVETKYGPDACFRRLNFTQYADIL